MKKDLVNILIENEWYNATLAFIKKAYKIDDKTMQAFVNGNKPTINDEILAAYEEKIDELLVKGTPDEKKEDTLTEEVNEGSEA